MQWPIYSQGVSETQTTASAVQSNVTETRRRVTQNSCLIWLDANLNTSNNDYDHAITELRHSVNSIDTFTDVDQCVDFLTDIKDGRVLMIISSDLGQRIIGLIHDVSPLNSVYVFCKNNSIHQQWAIKWSKVKGIFTQMDHICKSLKQATRQYDQYAVSLSFMSANDLTNQNVDQLDPSFMCTQLLKELLFEIDYNKQSMIDLTLYCREYYSGNTSDLKIITEFERDYYLHSPIWWYTGPFFLYSMLNHALRTQEVSTIIKMGFFIRDLHQNIKKLHSKRISDRWTASFVVYRGQGLSKIDFDKMLKSKGGLMAFNNFLSTSIDRDISYIYADSSLENPESVGIFFVITINTSISSVPFANIKDVSYFPSENEILFSMHTVFRIGEIQQIDGNHRLWQVNLTLTSDNDPQLAALTKRMQQEIKSGHPGWCRLGALLEKLGEFEKAEEVYQVLFNQITDDRLKPHLYQLLGNVKGILGNYEQSLFYFQRSLEIYQKIVPSDHHQLITSYNNMAVVYTYMGDYAKASSYYERVIEVRQRNLPPNHPSLATALCNIGFVFFKKKEYSKALSYYKKAEAMYQKSLPSNHPDLSACYSNIAGAYNSMGKYTEALSYLEKILDIDTKTLPSDHPHLASDYNNIGYVFICMREYSKAIPYLERSVAIEQRLSHSSHPNLETYRRNLENARKNLYKKC